MTGPTPYFPVRHFPSSLYTATVIRTCSGKGVPGNGERQNSLNLHFPQPSCPPDNAPTTGRGMVNLHGSAGALLGEGRHVLARCR